MWLAIQVFVHKRMKRSAILLDSCTDVFFVFDPKSLSWQLFTGFGFEIGHKMVVKEFLENLNSPQSLDDTSSGT